MDAETPRTVRKGRSELRLGGAFRRSHPFLEGLGGGFGVGGGGGGNGLSGLTPGVHFGPGFGGDSRAGRGWEGLGVGAGGFGCCFPIETLF